MHYFWNNVGNINRWLWREPHQTETEVLYYFTETFFTRILVELCGSVDFDAFNATIILLLLLSSSRRNNPTGSQNNAKCIPYLRDWKSIQSIQKSKTALGFIRNLAGMKYSGLISETDWFSLVSQDGNPTKNQTKNKNGRIVRFRDCFGDRFRWTNTICIPFSTSPIAKCHTKRENTQ